MSRDELLTKLAMELSKWPVTRRQARKAMPDVEWSEIGASVLAEPGDGGQSITVRHWLDERTRLINRPSWDDAPGYAEWLAQDVDGTWFWYLDEPRAQCFLWAGHVCDVDKCTRGATPVGHDWRETREQRPAETIPPEDTVEISELLLWDGTSWPPPVGTHCMARNPYTEDDRLEKATVIHHSRKGAVVVEHDHGDVAILTAPGDFSPIRPAERKAVEALANVLKQYGIIPNPDNSVRTVVYRAIYDAIRNDEIPDVKLECGGEAIDEPCQKLNFGSNAGATLAEVDALLKQYRKLHDGLTEMIESGRITQADIPDDYKWLVEGMLVRIASHPGQSAIG